MSYTINLVEDDMVAYQMWQDGNLVPMSTKPLTGYEQEVLLLSNALAGEIGECANVVKKALRHNPQCKPTYKNGLQDAGFLEDIKEELGDSLWYFTRLCARLGFTLEGVARANRDKLEARREEDRKTTASQQGA